MSVGTMKDKKLKMRGCIVYYETIKRKLKRETDEVNRREVRECDG